MEEKVTEFGGTQEEGLLMQERNSASALRLGSAGVWGNSPNLITLVGTEKGLQMQSFFSASDGTRTRTGITAQGIFLLL